MKKKTNMFSKKIILILNFTTIVVVYNAKNAKTGQTYVQTPSQYCSSERLPKLSNKELEKLSKIDLCAPLSTESTDDTTPEHHGMTSLTDLNASSSTEYQSNEKAEEYNKTNEKKKKKKKIT